MSITQFFLSCSFLLGIVNFITAADEAQTVFAFDDLQKQVEELKKEDVAWRRIAWKTCLLDGLQASRRESKPIMVWMFIDRPIDDERC